MFTKKNRSAVVLTTSLVISGCGGGGGPVSGTSFAALTNNLANLNASSTSLGFTPEVNMATGSATYNGVANLTFGTGAGLRDSALGALRVNVNFTGDTLDGSITNFHYLDQSAVAGNVAITNGALTGNNTAIGDGLTADANGNVGGNTVAMDVTGHFSGDSADVLYLYMDGKTDASLGVGIAAK